MAKRLSAEQIETKLRRIEVLQAQGKAVHHLQKALDLNPNGPSLLTEMAQTT
jgi:hypothetical protein